MDNLEKHHSLISCDDVISMYDLSGRECLIHDDLSSCVSPDMLDISLIYPQPYNNVLVSCFHEDYRVREILYNSSNKLFATSLYKPPLKYPTDCDIDENHIYSTFLNVCSVKTQQVFSQSPVVFDISNAICGNCGFTSNDSKIYIWKSGYYLICISNEIAKGFVLFKNGVLMNEITMGTNIIIKITNDNLSELLSTNELGCNLQVVNNTDAPIILPNVSFSLLFINDV